MPLCCCCICIALQANSLALKGRLILFIVCSSVLVCFWPGELAGWHWLTLCHRCDRSVPEIATVVAIFFATLLASLPVAKKLPLPPLLVRSFFSSELFSVLAIQLLRVQFMSLASQPASQGSVAKLNIVLWRTNWPRMIAIWLSGISSRSALLERCNDGSDDDWSTSLLLSLSHPLPQPAVLSSQ